MDVKPTVFIGSSSERQEVARAIELNLERVAHVTIWPHAFSPGRSVFEDLLEQSRRFDFAIIVMSPDDVVKSRGIELPAPRDNVVFELGLFLGALGRERVFAVMEESTPPKIMSDYKGVTYLTYDGSRPRGQLPSALSPSSTRIIGEIERLGKLDKSSEVDNYLFPGSMIGLERVYESFDSARSFIFNDIRSTVGPIRIFIHIASQDVGQNGSFFDVLEEVVKRGQVDVRVLHAGHESPIFDKDRIIAIGKDHFRVLRSLKWASESLQLLEKLDNSPLRRRSHSLPFIWRIYCVADRLYLMPYFSDKDAVKTSPVLVFQRSQRSMYNVFRDWFDHTWLSSTPETVDINDIVSPVSPAGAALLLKWEDKHVFGIPKRDLKKDSKSVRFYGIGGKRETGQETFDRCAVREAQEELSGALQELVDAHTTSYVRSDGTARDISVSGIKVRPRLIVEKANPTGFGTKIDDYTLVAFIGKLRRPPRPSRELAAVLLLSDVCLGRFIASPVISLKDALDSGAEIYTQDSIHIDEDTTIIPHGTATFLVRMLSTI